MYSGTMDSGKHEFNCWLKVVSRIFASWNQRRRVSAMPSSGSFVWSRSSEGARRAGRWHARLSLRVATPRADQSGHTNDADSRLPAIGNPCDADSRAWTTRRVRAEVLDQHRADGAFGLHV
jgi:hypothetical protein